MKAFDVHIPTRIIFGSDQAPKFIKALTQVGKRIFIVTGGGSVARLGYLNHIETLLKDAGVDFFVFSGIEPNPHASTIDRAAQEARKFSTDVFLALGGGSVMDATKAISGLVASDEAEIWPFTLGADRTGQLRNALPIAAIPTTAATASEVTPYAVISNPELKAKAPIAHPAFKPFLAWLNPEFTYELPTKTTQDGASDIMSHVFENYLLGGNDSPIADRYSEGILETVMQTLPLAVATPKNYDYRSRLLWASTLALNGLQQAGRTPGEFVLHAMEHALSGFYPDLAHGRGLATLYPAYFRWMIQNDRAVDRFALLAERLFSVQEGTPREKAEQFVSHFEAWLHQNNLLQSLEELGISASLYDAIAEYTIRVYGRKGELNALGPIRKQDIVEIFTDTARQH